MNVVRMLKGKFLIIVIVAVTLVGGAAVAFAATPAGQDAVRAITHSPSTAATPHAASHKDNDHNTTNSSNDCPGLSEAQKLASKFSLSTDSKSATIRAICALRQGTFKGTTASGASVSYKRAFGYGEIEMLLTYAQYLAAHDKANTGSKLTSNNVLGFLAQALQGCGTTSLESCLKTNVPGYQPGNSNGNGNGTGKPDGTPGSHGSGNGDGKPTSTPTPPAHH